MKHIYIVASCLSVFATACAVELDENGHDVEASTIEVQINGIPISAMEEQGEGSVESMRVDGGTQWKIMSGTDSFIVTQGRLAIKERIDAIILELDNDPRVLADQRTSAVDELMMIASRLGTLSAFATTQADCSSSLNFAPSFQRNMWYGRVWSNLTWTMWPGPSAPWQNWMYANAIADGITYYHDPGWSSVGPFLTTQGRTVTSYAVAGPENTGNIVLYAYAYFDSTGCQPLWFQQVNSL